MNPINPYTGMGKNKPRKGSLPAVVKLVFRLASGKEVKGKPPKGKKGK